MTSLQRFVSVPAVALAVLLGGAGIVAAQTTPVVTGSVTTSPVSITPGTTGASLGTVTLNSSLAGPTFVTSIPLSITTANGATLADLTGCQVFNSNGVALNTGANVVNSVQGTNTITLDAPLQVTGGIASALTVRCNISGSAAGSGTFQFTTGNPVLTPALSIVTPNLTVATVVAPGAQDAIVANILLDATRSGTAVSFSSLPLTFSAGGGGSVASLSDCRVRNPVTGNAALNSTANVISEGTNTVVLDSAVTVAAGSALLLNVTCDVSPAASAGNTFQVGITPGSIAATSVGSGNTVTPTGAVSGTLTSSGVPVLVLAASVPGVPDTGSEGQTATILALSALAAVIGALYLRRRLA